MPEIITVEDLRMQFTRPVIEAKARGVIKPATLKSGAITATCTQLHNLQTDGCTDG